MREPVTGGVWTKEGFANFFDLRGRIAAVTGGGQGIGLAVAERLAAARCSMAIIDVNGNNAQEAAERLKRNLSTGRNNTSTGRGSAGIYSLAISSRVGTLHNVRIFFTRSSIWESLV